MDLQLHAGVLWRFRALVAFGVLLGLALAFVSYVKIGENGLAYRQQEEWLSRATLLVTRQGSPEFRTKSDENLTPLASIAVLYSGLLDSDGVRSLMAPKNPPKGRIVTAPVTSDEGISLPLITVEALSSSAQKAVTLAQLQSAAFIEFVRRQQDSNAIPPADRVQVKIVSKPSDAFVFTPRSKTLPIVILLSVLVVTIALAFLLENLRPRVRKVAEADAAAGATEARDDPVSITGRLGDRQGSLRP